ncbi:MAG: hypothetical protein AAB588_02625 [Patescibacteria group bacterium]
MSLLKQAKLSGWLDDVTYQKLLTLSDKFNDAQIAKLDRLLKEAVSKREAVKKKALDEERGILDRYLKKISHLGATLFKGLLDQYKKIVGREEEATTEGLLEQIQNA